MTQTDVPSAAILESENFSEPWSEQAYYDALVNRNAQYVVADNSGIVIGCCGLWQSFETAEITNVMVLREARRRGVAQRMLSELMRLGVQRGVSQFTLEVRSSNIPAVRLYEGLGFITEGVRRGFYTKPREDALIMWKR